MEDQDAVVCDQGPRPYILRRQTCETLDGQRTTVGFKSIEVALKWRSAPASEPTVSAFLRAEHTINPRTS